MHCKAARWFQMIGHARARAHAGGGSVPGCGAVGQGSRRPRLIAHGGLPTLPRPHTPHTHTHAHTHQRGDQMASPRDSIATNSAVAHSGRDCRGRGGPRTSDPRTRGAKQPLPRRRAPPSPPTHTAARAQPCACHPACHPRCLPSHPSLRAPSKRGRGLRHSLHSGSCRSAAGLGG